MVIDFDELRTSVDAVIDVADHAPLKEIVEIVEIVEMPTVENLCRWLPDRLREELPGLALLPAWEGDGKLAELAVAPREAAS